MSFTLIAGFATIAGLIAGYGSGRIGPRWMLWGLWLGSALAVLAMFGLLQAGPPLDDAADQGLKRIAGFVAVLAFAIAAFCAGALGWLMRKILDRKVELP